jgi:hypothetical protein
MTDVGTASDPTGYIPVMLNQARDVQSEEIIK